jgi:hypothetical protein
LIPLCRKGEGANRSILTALLKPTRPTKNYRTAIQAQPRWLVCFKVRPGPASMRRKHSRIRVPRIYPLLRTFGRSLRAAPRLTSRKAVLMPGDLQDAPHCRRSSKRLSASSVVSISS